MTIDLLHYRPQRSREGYVFTPASVHAGIPHPLDQAPPGSKYPLEQAPPRPGTPPGTRHPPRPGTHPRDQAAPRTRHPPQQTATVADGTHPTGLYSCFFPEFFHILKCK